MGIYIFQHPKTNERKEIFQNINDEHSYVDQNGVKWNRVFTIPNTSIDSVIGFESESEFSEKMGRKRGGTIGDLMDASKEASEKRTKVYGKDPVKQRYFQDWSKKRKGKKHPGSYED
jgi:hypothetical protein